MTWTCCYESQSCTRTPADNSHAVDLTNHIYGRSKWGLQKNARSDSKQTIAITLNTSLKDLLAWSPALTDRLVVCRPAVLFWHRLVVMRCRLCVAGRVMIYISRVRREGRPGSERIGGIQARILFYWTEPLPDVPPDFITSIVNVGRVWLRWYF